MVAGYTEDRARREYFTEPDGESVAYAIVMEGEVVGMIQSRFGHARSRPSLGR